MDHRDRMNDWTIQMMEESRRQMMSGFVPPIEMTQPAIDIAQFNQPAFEAMDRLRDQLTRQAGDIVGTAIQGNTRLQEQLDRQSASLTQAAIDNSGAMRTSLSEQTAGIGGTALAAYLGNDLGVFAQAQEVLARSYRPPTIGDYLARTHTASIFALQGSTIAEQLAGRVDTKSLMGLGGVTETAGTIAEQWRLANSGALSTFGESFGSLRAALDFEESLKSSTLARAFLLESRKLQDDQVSRLAEAKLTETAEAQIAAQLEADQDLIFVVAYIQCYFIEYLGYSPSEAHNVVKWIVRILVFGSMLAAFATTAAPIQGTVGLFLGIAGMDILVATSEKAADRLIPHGAPDALD